MDENRATIDGRAVCVLTRRRFSRVASRWSSAVERERVCARPGLGWSQGLRGILSLLLVAVAASIATRRARDDRGRQG